MFQRKLCHFTRWHPLCIVWLCYYSDTQYVAFQVVCLMEELQHYIMGWSMEKVWAGCSVSQLILNAWPFRWSVQWRSCSIILWYEVWRGSGRGVLSLKLPSKWFTHLSGTEGTQLFLSFHLCIIYLLSTIYQLFIESNFKPLAYNS